MTWRLAWKKQPFVAVIFDGYWKVGNVSKPKVKPKASGTHVRDGNGKWGGGGGVGVGFGLGLGLGLGKGYYRKRGSASYIVREVHSVRKRERYREREREKDGSDVTIVALKLAMSFALLLAKNVHLSIGDEFCAFPCQKICTSVSPLLNGAEFTLSVAKNVALFETVRILRTVKWRDWQGIEAAKQTIEFPAAPFFFLAEKIEKLNQINTKNYWK